MSDRPRRPLSPRQARPPAGRSDDDTDAYYGHAYDPAPAHYGRGQAGPVAPDYDEDDYEAPRGRRGRLVTPVRLLLALAVVGSGLAALYGLFVVRSLPITVSSLAVLGISSALLGLIAGAASIGLARDGRAGASVLAALLGGMLVMGAAGSLAGALVLALLVGPS